MIDRSDSPLEPWQTAAASAAEELLQELHGGSEDARGVSHTLRALELLVGGSNREAVVEGLRNSSWEDRHDILTRWEWCRAQRQAIQRNHFNRPFLCKVGQRHLRRTLDREFATFLCFVPLHPKAHEQEWLLLEHGDTSRAGQKTPPDFVVEDRDGERIGIEVTEITSPESGSLSSQAQEDLEQVIARLRTELPPAPVALWFHRYPSGSKLLERADLLVEWLRREIEGRVISGSARAGAPSVSCDDQHAVFAEPVGDPLGPEEAHGVVISNEELGTSVELVSGSEGFVWTLSDGGGWASDEIEKVVAARLKEQLAKKLKKLNERHSISRPCILVAYQNTGLPDVDLERVKQLFAMALGDASPLDEVWLIGGNLTRAVRLA